MKGRGSRTTHPANGGGALFFTADAGRPRPASCAFWLLGSGLVGLLE